MSPQELKALILSDTAATALYNAGNDGECAAYLRANYTEPRKYQITKLQLYASFGIVRGLTIMQTLRALGGPSSAMPEQAVMFREIVDLLESQNADRGPDLGLPETGYMLEQWVQAGILTSQERDTLVALGRQPLSVTPAEIEYARLRT